MALGEWDDRPLLAGFALGLLLPVAGLTAEGAHAATVRLVGPQHEYPTPCRAIQAAQAGDTILIDAAGNGGYDGDVCAWSTSGLTVSGYRGRARIAAAGRTSQGKAIWVIAGNDTTVRNVELSGAAVPDRNGAAIRLEGTNLRLEQVYFHDNENGLLTGANPASDIVIERSEFARNGHGDGYSHNLYIGRIHSFTLRESYSHDARVGHLVKSRAQINRIFYNRLTGEGGTASYELDLPNGGLAHVIGNVFQQGPASENPALVSFGVEGSPHPGSALYLVNNTLVDGLGKGAAVVVEPGLAAAVTARNNLAVGSLALVSQPGALLEANCLDAGPKFLNPARSDYRLKKGSPCIDAGQPPGSGGGESLLPLRQYVFELSSRPRRIVGKAIDAGAFEFGS